METGSTREANIAPGDRASWSRLIGRFAGDTLPIGEHPVRSWKALQRIDDLDASRANVQAHADRDGGAAGFAVCFEGAPNAFGFGLPGTEEALDIALGGIALSGLHLRIDVHPASRASAGWLLRLLAARKVDPDSISVSLGIDPAAIFAGTGRLRTSVEALQASMPQSLAHFFGLGVPGVLLEADGRVFHNAGATPAQELGIMLSSAASYLRMFQEARQPLLYALPHIGFALSVDHDRALSVAKVSVIQELWSRVQDTARAAPRSATIHAETSCRMLSLVDPDDNVVRNAIACAGAVEAGADTISVLPHTVPFGLPDPEARRLARGTQRALATGEASAAAPPVDAGEVEARAADLRASAWSEFTAIEAEGGIMASVASGAIQKRIRAARDAQAVVLTEDRPQPSGRAIRVLPAVRRPASSDGTAFCDRLELVSAGDIAS